MSKVRKNQKPEEKPIKKKVWGPGSLLAPVPAVLVTVRDKDGRENVLTVAWTGTLCTNPSLVYISVRKERYSYEMLKNAGEFVINLTTKKMVRAVDYCGVRSGRDGDKFEACHLKTSPATKVNAPLLNESPLNLECRILEVKELGSHDMFIAEVMAIDVSESCIDEKGRLELEKAELISFAHGQYFELGQVIGSFGFSVKKK